MSDQRNSGDAWITAADGARYWGRFGAAGLLVIDRARDEGRGAILLQHRVTWSDHGDTWGIPGGARHEGESPIDAAIRESQEEAGVPDDCLRPRFTHVLDRGVWAYTTLIAEVTTPFEPSITDAESHALAWVPLDQVTELPLHPAFAASWEILKPLLVAPPAVIVDAANVIGSVPNGWWKDRRGAAERLRDRLDLLAASPDGLRSGFVGVPESRVPGLDRVFPDWIMVTEGVARGIAPGSLVQVLDAVELGDDAIIQETDARAAEGALVAVVTSDAELKVRVGAAGASSIHGTQTLVKLLPELPEPAGATANLTVPTELTVPTGPTDAETSRE
ncbi:8-oxo-dGTP pyrophosphatase MutT (NUDIX family) [Leucobacter exalbidus]|uniref:8-oxo-dGTP pyrophosphatase MutT (NUDIX family) n=1 Tax=Leucobacter exalbidus TaxID=662960 RepID=A0A940T5E8_9MICO|nr:NUDIX domain-containing protein [Leucobacter exalbidus]MBP1325921.1 8-oxo-dGTP pyrophosphatase MutT (NUDIX family) [Leucobacter exalbidus]